MDAFILAITTTALGAGFYGMAQLLTIWSN